MTFNEKLDKVLDKVSLSKANEMELQEALFYVKSGIFKKEGSTLYRLEYKEKSPYGGNIKIFWCNSFREFVNKAYEYLYNN